MLITDKESLNNYKSEKRIWQGIPKLEITKNGIRYLSFTSGGIRDGIGNYVALTRQEGNKYHLIAIIKDDDPYYVHDSCLWIDPLGRLWFFATKTRDYCVVAYIIDNPEDKVEKLHFSNEKVICDGTIFHQPIVSSKGDYLFSSWINDHEPYEDIVGDPQCERKSFLVKSSDAGKTWKKVGSIAVKGRHYDSSAIMERNDGTILMYVRTNYGISVSSSKSGGRSWQEQSQQRIKSADSTFCIKKLKSGRWLLIRHDDPLSRNNLTAFISEDEGKTYPYKLLLDERDNLSCPFVKVDENDVIHVVYDRERGSFCKNARHALSKAREILEAEIKEDNILRGEVGKDSILKKTLLKLSKYTGNDFINYQSKRGNDTAKQIIEQYPNDEVLLNYLYDHFAGGCSSLTEQEKLELAQNIAELQENQDIDKAERVALVNRIINLCSLFYGEKNDENSGERLLNQVITFVNSNLSDPNMNVDSISKELHFSRYYLTHLFKECTGLSISEYITSKRVQTAKKLISSTSLSFQEIGEKIGIVDNVYLSKWFVYNVGVSMSEYRKMTNN